MGANAVAGVRTARKYVLFGAVSQEDVQTISRRVLANDCIEEVIYGSDAEPPSPHIQPYQMNLVHIPIRELDEEGLVRLSKEKDLFLNLTEMRTIQDYFKRIGREPTDIELESLAQTWSEHCVHKTLKSAVEMEHDGKTIRFGNLLKETVFKATQELNKDWCISVFADNAVIEFEPDMAVCFKVGKPIITPRRWILMVVRQRASAVSSRDRGYRDGGQTGRQYRHLLFCPAGYALSEVPKGVLHPRRIMKGVVSGVRDYGNRMGIPTVNGAIYFDDRYVANPLVFCGNIGLIPRDKCFKHQKSGDYIVVVGGRTGRDGIHGATFSSGEMTHEHETIFSHAVQIGNAITEKKMLDVLLMARDQGLYDSITDCGAGGLSSAVGEMGEKLGAVVEFG